MKLASTFELHGIRIISFYAKGVHKFKLYSTRLHDPLTNKLCNGEPKHISTLTDEEALTLTTVQEKILPPQVLVLSRKDEKSLIDIDAWYQRVKWIFPQWQLKGYVKHILNWSNTLTVAESGYDTILCEFLAFVCPTHLLKSYVRSPVFTVWTGHKVLESMLNVLYSMKHITQ